MQIKNPTITYSDIDPFEGCILNRRTYAENLTKLISNYNGGMVIALNNRWGTGKTTFIEMWRRLLVTDDYNFKTVYFNAWENDFEDEPMTALLGELTTLKSKDSKTFKSVLQAASNLAVEIIPAVAKGIATKYITEDGVGAIEGAAKGSLTIMNKLIENYANKKQSLVEFRNELQISINTISPDKPIIFFIDELDRCRPNYSVSILEKIKHFFNVENIVFVLSIDKIQLGHAVGGVYNSNLIDVDNYLKKFFDIEYSLPDPSNKKYIDYLFKYYKIDTYFKEIPLENENEDLNFKEFYYKAFDKQSLRDLEKICGTTSLALVLFKNHKIDTIFFAFLIYLKFSENELYKNLQTKQINIENTFDVFNKISSKLSGKGLAAYILPIEAYFYMCYSNYLGDDLFFSWIYNGNQVMRGRDNLFNYYRESFRTGLNRRLSLKLFLDRIELSADIQIN